MNWTAPAFPALGIEDAHLRQSLLAALNGARVGDDVLRAQIVAPPDGTWFLCAHDIAFRIQTLEGHPVRMDAQDGAAMARLLDAADPLLAAIEVALGIALEPTDMGQRLPTATIIAAIETATSHIDLALPIDAPLLPTPAPLTPELVGHIPLPARIGIEGPRLSPIDAAALVPGDLLLLGPAPFAATLRPAKGAPLPGIIHPADRQFRTAPTRTRERTKAMNEAEAPTLSPNTAPAAPSFPTDDFAVQLRFELDPLDIPLSRLQALQGGGVVPLEDREGALPVRILAGNRPIATGQIVSIGDSYGILVESILKEG